MRSSRLPWIVALAAALILAVLVYAVSGTRAPAEGLAIGAPFVLTDGDGHKVTDASYAGYWRLVYFGYTHCPDACPTTLSTLAAALDKLPPASRARVRVLFITVDPARDTPAVIGPYARAFGPEFTGLTGTPAQLQPAEAGYHVYASRHELKDGDYAMDHSSVIYVMAPDGHFAGVLDDTLSPADMAKNLRGFGA